MLNHAKRFDDYFAMTIEINSSLDFPKTPSYNLNVLGANSGLAGKIASALEGLTPNDKIAAFKKDAHRYATQMIETMQKDFDVLKKEVALGHETIDPLLKVDNIFAGIYGKDVSQQLIMSTPIVYYKNTHHSFVSTNGSYPFFLTERFASIFNDPVAIRDEMIRYFNNPANNHGQVEMPKINAQSALPKSPVSLEELEYDFETVTTGLDRILRSGEQIKLADNSNATMNNIKAIKTELDKTIDSVSSYDDSLPDKLANIDRTIAILHNQMVALATTIILYHAVLYSAYNAAYQIHMAEIDYNKSQQGKKR